MSPRERHSRLIDAFKRLSIRCIESDLPGYAENFCNLLAALQSGQWDKLDKDEHLKWLRELDTLLHPRGLGDSLSLLEPSYQEASALVAAMMKGAERTAT